MSRVHDRTPGKLSTRCGIKLETWGKDTFIAAWGRSMAGNIVLIAGVSLGCPDVTCAKCEKARQFPAGLSGRIVTDDGG